VPVKFKGYEMKSSGRNEFCGNFALQRQRILLKWFGHVKGTEDIQEEYYFAFSKVGEVEEENGDVGG
jgi:hypothetical protein